MTVAVHVNLHVEARVMHDWSYYKAFHGLNRCLHI